MSLSSQEAPPTVRVATEADRARVLSVITLAFATDPMVRWVLADADAYLAVMPQFADAFGGGGLAQGGALLADDGAGAALWLPPGEHPDQARMGELMQPHVRVSPSLPISPASSSRWLPTTRMSPTGTCR
jgi:hypothetical protein